MTKYYRRGTREFYMVTEGKMIKVLNKEFCSYVTVAYGNGLAPGVLALMIGDVVSGDGIEISRDEFAKEFEVASRLIVLEP